MDCHIFSPMSHFFQKTFTFCSIFSCIFQLFWKNLHILFEIFSKMSPVSTFKKKPSHFIQYVRDFFNFFFEKPSQKCLNFNLLPWCFPSDPAKTRKPRKTPLKAPFSLQPLCKHRKNDCWNHLSLSNLFANTPKPFTSDAPKTPKLRKKLLKPPLSLTSLCKHRKNLTKPYQSQKTLQNTAQTTFLSGSKLLRQPFLQTFVSLLFSSQNLFSYVIFSHRKYSSLSITCAKSA